MPQTVEKVQQKAGLFCVRRRNEPENANGFGDLIKKSCLRQLFYPSVRESKKACQSAADMLAGQFFPLASW